MKNIFAILILLLFLSCQKSNYKTVDFDVFEITVPSSWKKHEINGIDSYVGGLISDEKDTLIFDLGWYSPDVSDNTFPMVFDPNRLAELTEKERGLLPNTNHLIVDSLSAEIEYSKYPKYQVEYDSVDCFKVKLITPRNKGFGATGIYIDSIAGGDTSYNRVKFGFYGNHLTDSTQTEFIKALRSIKFKKYCSQQGL